MWLASKLDDEYYNLAKCGLVYKLDDECYKYTERKLASKLDDEESGSANKLDDEYCKLTGLRAGIKVG